MPSPSNRATTHPVLAIVAVSIGNSLEWFDIVIYGFLAGIIAPLFFPSGNPTVSLLLAYGTFGATFLMRPLGSIVLGAYADRVGRKRALTLSILLMMIGTLIVAVTPTHATIGLLAPVILTAARLLQGFSAGGEYGSSTAFLCEQNPARRGFYSSWQFASQGLTSLLASGFGLLLTAGLSHDTVISGAWRIPFVFGLLVGPVALYIRATLEEGEEYLASAHERAPLATALGGQKARMLAGMGLVIVATISIYTMLFMPTFAVRQLHIPAAAGFTATLIFGAIQLVFCPVFGRLSDRIGRVPVMVAAALLLLVGSLPLFFWLTASPSGQTILAVEVVLALLTAMYQGPSSAAMAELFPPGTRGTGLAISYSFGVAIFGGFAPFIVSWLIADTGSNLAPAFYLAFGAVLSLVALGAARRLGVR
jgi:MFS transporter, MHS family, proline/betaine transporter